MIVATAGHIDHGKTSLVRALTGVDTDRLPEEKARGLTIDIGFAHRLLPDGSALSFVDVPGHERFIRNMLAGVIGVDFALLVVAADDGAMPQTVEHLEILELLGISRGAVALTKIDRVDEGRRLLVQAEVEALLAPTGLGGAPVFPVSSVTGAGIEALRRYLDAAAAAPARASPGRFRLPVDRAFVLDGIGLVVTGTVHSGQASVGDRLLLSPRGLPVRIRGIHAQNRAAPAARAGERCAFNIVGPGVEKVSVHRGDWLLDDALHAPVQRIDAEIRLPPGERRATLRTGAPVHLHVGTADVTGRVHALEGREVGPGAAALVQLTLDQPVSALYGDRFVLRDPSATRTLAGGRVLDPFPPRRGRARPERLAVLAALREVEPSAALAALLDVTSIDLAAFTLARNLSDGEAEAVAARVPLVAVALAKSRVAVAPDAWARLQSAILEALGSWHERHPHAVGARVADLWKACPNPTLGPALFEAAIAALERAGAVARRGAMLRLPGHRPTLARKDDETWSRVRPLLARDGLRPPRVRELAEALPMELSALEAFLERADAIGLAARVAPNRYFLPDTLLRLAEVAATLAEEAPDRHFTAAAFKDRSGVGRNLTITILEYFDKAGLTRRIGEAREMAKAPPEVFAAPAV